jgi:hypothetical protein
MWITVTVHLATLFASFNEGRSASSNWNKKRCEWHQIILPETRDCSPRSHKVCSVAGDYQRLQSATNYKPWQSAPLIERKAL